MCQSPSVRAQARRLRASTRGASAVSYAIVVTFVAVLAMGSATVMGVSIRSLFSTTATTMQISQQMAIPSTPLPSPIPLPEGPQDSHQNESEVPSTELPDTGTTPPDAPTTGGEDLSTGAWPRLVFADTILSYEDPQLVVSNAQEIPTKILTTTTFDITASVDNAQPRLIVLPDQVADTPETTTVALQSRAPVAGTTTTVTLAAGGHSTVWTITRNPAPMEDTTPPNASPNAPENPLGVDAPPQSSTPTTPGGEVLDLGELIIPWASGQQVAQSPYISLGSGPFPFTVTASTGTAVATTTTAGMPASNGTLAWGTALEAAVPSYGRSTTITLALPNKTYTWKLAKEALPQVQNFDFGTTVIEWNDSRMRIASAYVDIPGLEFVPRPFAISGPGNPRLVSGVTEGDPAQAGLVANGTQIEVDVPEPGTQRTISITVGEGTGQWVVRRAAIPQADNRFALTGNNGMNWAQISFGARNIPQRPYSFSLSGTGNTQPQSNGKTSGQTDAWGINIAYNAPPRGVTETITLIIDGQRLQWTATGP